MDYEALKDQWSDIEDRDGIRLSWNTFPSSRMVRVPIGVPFYTIGFPAFAETSFRKHPGWLFPSLPFIHRSRRSRTRHCYNMNPSPASSPVELFSTHMRMCRIAALRLGENADQL